MKEESEAINPYRTMLFSIAYNMLGTLADAEDMVQETYASWLASDKSHVQSVKFYLIRTVSNKCITHLRKLKQERAAYIGTWLPEPIPSPLDVADGDSRDKLSIGFMYLLEKLTPIERGVIILKEAFTLHHDEISAVFEITTEQCRQHLSRAKKKLLLEKSRFTTDATKHEEILRKFLDACLSGDLDEMVKLLREDVTAYADGGGNAPAISAPLAGKKAVLRLLTGGAGSAEAYHKMDVRSINGWGCAAFYQKPADKSPSVLIAIDIDEFDQIVNIYYLVNPAKLKHIV